MKKLSRITFFVFRALFSSENTFFCPGTLFSVPEHFFSGITDFPWLTQETQEFPFFSENGESWGTFGNSCDSWEFLVIRSFFLRNTPGIQDPGKSPKSPELGPPCYIYRESALSIYIPGGSRRSIASQSKHSLSFAIAMRRSFHLYRPTDG